LAVVEHFSDEVAVMYLGRIVEKADARELYANPKHPYTTALLSAVPEPDPRRKRDRIVLGGEVPSPADPPGGCPFHPRCQLTREAAAKGAADPSATVSVVQRGLGGTISLRVLDYGGVTEVESGGETFRVLSKCAIQTPPLEAKNGKPGHVAACWVTE
jgi:oligopeptide/dipeptide ABC transporter ATP-binding protein